MSKTPTYKRKRPANFVGLRADGVGLIRIGRGTANILANIDDIQNWDDDELRRGIRRGSDGFFTGPPPKVIPRALYDELMKRTIDHCMEEMRNAMPDMIKVLTAIVLDEGVLPSDKIKAIDMCMKRVLGKEPIDVHVSAVEAPKWQDAIEVSIVNSDVNNVVFTDEDDEEFE